MLVDISVWIHADLFSFFNLDMMEFVSKIWEHFDFYFFSKVDALVCVCVCIHTHTYIIRLMGNL